MSTGRKSGSGGRTGGAPAVDPHAPTQTSLHTDDLPPAGAKKLASGAFTPDAPTKLMPPMTSFDDVPEHDDARSGRQRLAGAAGVAGAYDPDARTQAMNLGSPNDEDPFAPRVTEAELRSFSSEEAEGPPLLDPDEDGARVDLRPPGQRRSLPPVNDDDSRDVVEISLSDMDALPELADDDSEEDTHDTVVNMPLPASLRRDVDDASPRRSPSPISAPGARRAQIPPLPTATVVERRSHSPAALFDEDTASVTDPRGEKPAVVGRAPESPGDVDAGNPLAPALASERTAARPSLVSQPSGDPAPPDAAPAGHIHAADPLEAEAPPCWDEDSLPEAEPDETVAPELSGVSEDELPPLLHRWKVVPTVIQGLAPPPPAPQPSLDEERAKKLQTVLWSPNDEAAARAEHAAAARARNPFWAPTDVAADVDDDDPLESIEAAAPSDPRQAAAAYVHDALAYLRSLSYLGAHLDEEIRVDFDARLLGANEKLRRALTVLQSASNPANAAERDEPAELRQTRGVPGPGGFDPASRDDDDDDER